MSTNLAFKEPPNTLVYLGDYDCLVANYTSEKVRVDKNRKELRYKCTWTLSRFQEGQILFLGSMTTDVEAEDDVDCEIRIESIANIAARIIEAGYFDAPGNDVIEEHNGREIIAAVHARFMSQFLHSEKLEDAVLAVRAFLKKMNVKNTKKILSDVFDAKIVEDIKNKELK